MPEPEGQPPLSRRAFGGLVLASGLGLAGLGLAACAPVPRPSGPSRTRTPTPTSTPGASPGRGLVWSDEFDGPASAGLAASRWLVADRSDNPNDELEAYTARRENVSLDGSGSLRITARAESYSAGGVTRAYTSGRIESVEAFRYGRIEARIKVPAGPGLWPAFWTIGRYDATVQWPVTGEIDIMETVDDATTIHANVHADSTAAGTWVDEGTVSSARSYADDWHVYSVDWSADELVFQVDGAEFHRVRKADREPTDVWEFDRPQYILLDLAVGGDFPQEQPDPSAFPAEMLVDYVRVHDAEIFPRLE